MFFTCKDNKGSPVFILVAVVVVWCEYCSLIQVIVILGEVAVGQYTYWSTHPYVVETKYATRP